MTTSMMTRKQVRAGRDATERVARAIEFAAAASLVQAVLETAAIVSIRNAITAHTTAMEACCEDIVDAFPGMP